MSGTRAYTSDEVRALMSARWATGGELALDFSGEYVPVMIHDEAALAAALVAVYHNNCVSTNIQVRSYRSDNRSKIIGASLRRSI